MTNDNRTLAISGKCSMFNVQCSIVVSALPEQFFDGFAGIARRGRNVLEPPAKRIIVADGGVVDPERGIDRGGDIFGIDGTLFRPSRIVDVECIGRGFAQRSPAAYPSARDKGGMNEVMVPALPVCNVSDRASEFALDDDYRRVELCPAPAARHRRQRGDAVAQAY